MNTKRAHYVSIGGSPIPLIPVGDFDKLPHAMLKDAWRLIGPSVSRNIDRCSIWEVIAAAYLEGLNHGHGMASGEHPVKRERVTIDGVEYVRYLENKEAIKKLRDAVL